MIFISQKAAKFLHAENIALYGGTKGIRDEGLLLSALAAPRASWNGKYLMSFPWEMAGSYLVSLARNHAFIDGNKRTATSVALLFLRRNNIADIRATDGLIELTLAAATGKVNKKQCGLLLRTLSK